MKTVPLKWHFLGTFEISCSVFWNVGLNLIYVFIFSILESHLEEEEDELTANDNDESCWQDEEQGNDQGIK